MGNVLALAGKEKEETHVIEIEPVEARNKEIGINKIFKERRTDLYEL